MPSRFSVVELHYADRLSHAELYSEYRDIVIGQSEQRPADISAPTAERWFVAHSRPRCEKKVVEHCSRYQIATTLPCYRSVRKYLRKTVSFEKPLFPGYVFIRAVPQQRATVRQSDYVANLLEVHDQQQFQHQLSDVLAALDSGLEIRLAPEIGAGTKVRIKHGPLAGIEGSVESRYGFDTVLLRLDFIGQAAAVKLNADDLERI